MNLESEPDFTDIEEAITDLLKHHAKPSRVTKTPKKPRKVCDKPPGRQMKRQDTPAVSYVKSIDPDYCTIGEVAEILDVSTATLRNWMKDPDHPTAAPSLQGHLGKMKIYIYTPEDVQALRDWRAARSGVTKREPE